MKTSLLATALSALLIGTAGIALAQTSAPAPLAPAQAPAVTAAPVPAAAPAAVTAPPARTTGAAPRPATPTIAQFKTEAEAKARCGADTVVWGSSESKAFHLAGSRYYGKTKSGAFMCRKDAEAAHYHAARTRASTTAAHPAATPSSTATPPAAAPAAAPR